MKKKLKKDLIPGIFNYCDAWCKRCPFKDRCAIGGLGEWDLELEDADGECRQITGIIHSVDVSVKVLGDASAWESPEEEEAYEKRQFELRRLVRQHEITKLAKKYRQATRQFFEKTVIEKMREKMEKFDGMMELGTISPDKVKESMIRLGDNLEKIEWYHMLIEVKMQVALKSQLDDEWEEAEEGIDEELRNMPKHHDGTAKVVLLSIDKCIPAWKHVREVLTGAEPDASQALSMLEELKNMIIQSFPDAMKFQRPGFDDEKCRALLN